MIARGANRQGNTVFEVEIAGQRLALPSRVPLLLGKRYELEKLNELEFRIVREIESEEKDSEHNFQPRKIGANTAVSQEEAIAPINYFSLAELTILRLLEDSGRSVSEQDQKYLFDFSGEFELRGLFHPQRDGKYILFASGALAANISSGAFAAELKELGIHSIKIVDAAVFDRLKAGAIDLKL